MKILVSGASGLVGKALIEWLLKLGHQPIRLVRRKSAQLPGDVFWDPENSDFSIADFEGFDAVVNLSGENIASGRWSEEKKQKIFDSRINTTHSLCKCLTQLKSPPSVLVNASAVGFYGNRGDEVLNENSSSGPGFLSHVCQSWEQAAEQAKSKGIRVVCLRLGVVLSSSGGALAKMLPPFKFGLGGTLGSGKQYMSWITMEDLLKIILFSIDKTTLEGPVNAVSPQPITNQVFTKTLGRVLNRPTIFSVPAFAIKFALGEMGEEMLLSSTRAIPQRLIDAGFVFKYPELEAALRHEISR